MENRGQVLSKEQILERLWDNQGKFVDDNTVSVNIRRLRMKIEEDPSSPRLIEDSARSGIYLEGGLMTGILAVFCAVMGGLAVLYRKKYKNLYQTIDTMLEEVLSEKKNTHSLPSGKGKSLAGRQDAAAAGKTGFGNQPCPNGEGAGEKSNSNMSHQLKTPLANVVMYEEILEAGVEEAETQREFQRRLKEQTRKLDWILQSL